jgi:hypothetical protein
MDLLQLVVNTLEQLVEDDNNGRIVWTQQSIALWQHAAVHRAPMWHEERVSVSARAADTARTDKGEVGGTVDSAEE